MKQLPAEKPKPCIFSEKRGGKKKKKTIYFHSFG